MIERGIVLVDRNLDSATIGERRLVGRTQRLQPVQQLAHIAHIGGRRQLLTRFAELAAQPGEIKQLHRPTSLKGRKSTMLPDSSRVNASGSSTRPSASTSELRMPAPSRGNLLATRPPSASRERRARRNSRRSFFFLWSKSARTR